MKGLEWLDMVWLGLDGSECLSKMSLKNGVKFALGIQSQGYTHPSFFLCIIRYANIICYFIRFHFRQKWKLLQMYHFSLHLKFCKNTYKLFWKYFCFAFIHYRRAQFILSKFANFCLSEFSMFCLKFSLLKPHPKNTPHFNTSFVKILENFSTPLHLFIRVPNLSLSCEILLSL